MTLKAFFITTAALEVGAGITLILAPLQAAKLLLGTSPNDPAAVVIEKIAGCALIALALANWLARNDDQNAAARGIVWGMVVYNLGVVAVLILIALAPFGQAQIQPQLQPQHLLSQTVGVLLWPAVILHILMSIWCGLCLAKKRV